MLASSPYWTDRAGRCAYNLPLETGEIERLSSRYGLFNRPIGQIYLALGLSIGLAPREDACIERPVLRTHGQGGAWVVFALVVSTVIRAGTRAFQKTREPTTREARALDRRWIGLAELFGGVHLLAARQSQGHAVLRGDILEKRVCRQPVSVLSC